MSMRTTFGGLWGLSLGLLVAVIAFPHAASAQLGGDTVNIQAFVSGGPHDADITVGPGVELAPGGGPALGFYPRDGESVDCGDDSCVFTFAPLGLAGSFVISGVDPFLDRELLDITVDGDALLSSDSHTTIGIDNEGFFARFTVDCNSFLNLDPCEGGTVVVNFIFAPIAGGLPIPAIMELKEAVLAQGFDAETEEKLTRRLETAISRLENGNPDGAISRMEGFIQKVERGQVTGAIGAIGDALIGAAEDIIALIQGA